jgi:hypothetical protein
MLARRDPPHPHDHADGALDRALASAQDRAPEYELRQRSRLDSEHAEARRARRMRGGDFKPERPDFGAAAVGLGAYVQTSPLCAVRP